MSIYAYQLLKVMGISEPRRLQILAKIQVQSLDTDHVIGQQGVRLDAFSHILSGLVGAGVPDKNGVITPIHIGGPGTWFGADTILNPQAVSLETICLTPVRLLVVPLLDAEEAFDQEPRFAQYLAQLMCWRNQQLVERLTLMRLGSPQLRVVMGLALLAQALHNSLSHQPSSELEDALDVPLKQSLLAAMCGVSRGIFSESVQQLAAAGWVRLNYATVGLSRLTAWRKFSSDHRNKLYTSKLSMPDILSLMSAAMAEA